MTRRATAHLASICRTTALERLAELGRVITPPIESNILQVMLSQQANPPTAIEAGYLIAQIVYPWPNWRAAEFLFRESYPAYMKYGAYPLPVHTPGLFIRQAERVARATEIRRLRTIVVGHLSSVRVDIRPGSTPKYTLFLIPHDLERLVDVTVGYLLAQFIYAHAIWQAKPLEVIIHSPAHIVCTVAVATQPEQ